MRLLPKRTKDCPDQALFDFLVPYNKPLLRVDEVCEILRCKDTHVYDLIDEGKLEAHEHPDRAVKRKRITRRSVVAWLARTALYDPADHLPRLLSLIPSLTSRAEVTELIKTATAHLSKLTH